MSDPPSARDVSPASEAGEERPQKSLLLLGVAVLGAMMAVLVALTAETRPRQSSLEAESSLAQAIGPEAGVQSEVQAKEGLFALALEVEGGVEVFSEEKGRWAALKLGEKLASDEVIRTKLGRATLGIGESIRVSIESGSQFALGELSRELSKVRLEDGRLSSQVRGGSSELRVTVRGSEAKATTKEGDLSVLRSHDGHVVVATTRGEVAVSAAGERVALEAGQQTVVEKESAPSSPMKISGKFFVRLHKGQEKKLRVRSTVVSGTTAPGSVVSVNGAEFVSADGRFTKGVALREGHNSIHVVARDAIGRKSSATLDGIEVDSRPPEVTGSVKW